MDESVQALKDEVARLAQEVETHRQRELAELRSALAAAREESMLWQAEARRISDRANELSKIYKEKLAEANAKLEAMSQIEVHARRFSGKSRN